MTPDARAVMRVLLRARMAEVPGLEVDRALQAEILRLVVAYTGYHVPARLKALEMYARGM